MIGRNIGPVTTALLINVIISFLVLSWRIQSFFPNTIHVNTMVRESNLRLDIYGLPLILAFGWPCLGLLTVNKSIKQLSAISVNP